MSDHELYKNRYLIVDIRNNEIIDLDDFSEEELDKIVAAFIHDRYRVSDMVEQQKRSTEFWERDKLRWAGKKFDINDENPWPSDPTPDGDFSNARPPDTNSEF